MILQHAVAAFASFDFTNGETMATTVQIALLLTVLTIAPGILIMMTCFTRIIIVLAFVRQGLATQSTPPNQVLIGLALFMTAFIMAPVIQEVYETAYVPLADGEYSSEEAFEAAVVPIKEFMSAHTREKDLALFMGYGGYDRPASIDDVPLTALVPAFAISELKTAFQIGFLIFIPFLVIDMIVASVLMSMGMMMLPPVMIALPFKVLLFVLVDGWYLVVQSLLISYQ
ncbi:flagellar biosynthetic protein FliP [Shouchella clausii]|jgi:flagellar biosynthesis protein FliP|uniref:Flagellar biosynthetic protein FliP n=3 Tax=Shouchella clausii TaxID=79880 RepID=A0A268S654_SHOCL|nr:flagellar type III secretion system pore protein FliP [Shouchella clausii]MBU8594857.1 flagellar type III secretion system pore protein FliP [Shouchella clausii]MCY1104920.1 flagellar type III secretion system pore protein FliP [Shouchella clausii]MEB5481465.1 flagellar type III secretion system pore protein FliP [Shouchella clausii]MED4157743.1 flagellar type III secretion system pore protein FliP [Shouchella clausii]MED4175210.1 flagellar type III secretion system pore protein FliP [Shouc